MKCIGVIDCNNFFVSCERLFRPDLRRVPVVVLSSNDGCVVARSKEIKDKGIPMGVPYFQVKDRLKDIGAVCFSSHFALYRDISSRVFSVVKSQLTQVEIYSIDEAFFSFEAASPADAVEVATALKALVEQSVGIPVSVGVSDTKTRAKLVNRSAKTGTGVAVSWGDDFLEEYGTTVLHEVWGIGRRLYQRYQAAGVSTLAQLVAMPVARTTALFGVAGIRLRAELLGQVCFRVTQSTAWPQSVMSTRSFKTKTNDLSLIKDALAYHVRSVMADLRAQGLTTLQLAVELKTSRHGDYLLRGGWQRTTLAAPTDSTAVVLSTALTLLNQLYEPLVPYNKVGIAVTSLLPRSFVPTTLFAPVAPSRQAGLDQVVDTLTARFGQHSLKLGYFSATPAWQAKQERISPAYTTSWKNLATVKTSAVSDLCT